MSSNIVGYQRVDLAQGLNLVGVQFQPVGGNGTAVINEILTVSGINGYDWDNFADGDEMDIFDPAAQGYTTFYQYAGDSVPDTITQMLGYDLSGKWMDASMQPVSDPTDLGDGVWIKTSSSAASITLSGEVSTNSFTKTLSIGLNLVANPYPEEWDINSATYSGLTGYDWDNFAEGDEMDLFDSDAQGYTTFYFYAGDSVPATITQMLGYDLSGKWMDSSMQPVSTPIPVGGAIWIKTSSSSARVTFAK